MRLKAKVVMWILSVLLLASLLLLWFQSINTLTMLASNPGSQAIESAAGQLNVILASVFILVMLSIAMGLVSARLVSGDVLRLRDAARDIGKGRFKTRINISTGDEIEELADSLNRMARGLEQYEHELEKKNAELEGAVKKRTKELEGKIEVLERLNRLSVGRELKMIELKDRIKDMEKRHKRK